MVKHLLQVLVGPVDVAADPLDSLGDKGCGSAARGMISGRQRVKEDLMGQKKKSYDCKARGNRLRYHRIVRFCRAITVQYRLAARDALFQSLLMEHGYEPS